MSTIVETWFGSAFGELHPLLQRLHREGGVLSGPVDVCFGRGIAGVIGRRLARGLGVPDAKEPGHLQVSIRSSAEALHWNRRFNGFSEFRSTFIPAGSYPQGHWVESSGKVRLHLRVCVVNGGWHWQHLSSRLWGLPLPRWLAPRTNAYKEIREGMYYFHVAVVFPLVGTVLSYSGNLAPDPSIERTSSSGVRPLPGAARVKR